jgi:sortase A
MKLRILIPGTVHLDALRYLFLALAIACLGLYGYVYLDRVLYQAYESREFDRIGDPSPVASRASDDNSAPVMTTARSRREPARPSRLAASPALIGRLSVPRLRLTAMVREGIDGKTLRLAVGHIPATPLPGQVGNVGVAGHRDTFFRGLRDLRTKDEIRFSTFHGDFEYEVESLSVVEPDNVGVLASSSAYVLTLVTCYPFSYVGRAPKRFVVRARQVSPQTAPPLDVE